MHKLAAVLLGAAVAIPVSGQAQVDPTLVTVHMWTQEAPAYAVLLDHQVVTQDGTTGPIALARAPAALWFVTLNAIAPAGNGVTWTIEVQDPATKAWVPLQTLSSSAADGQRIADLQVTHLVPLVAPWVVGTYRAAYTLDPGTTSATLTISAEF